MRTRGTESAANTILALILLMCLASAAPADAVDGRYENTFQKDFVMDAPWRVEDVDTAIPVTIILKDCDTDDIRELHWIRLWDVTSGEIVLWDHDFGDELIGDDAYESNYWTYVTTVTEGHPALPDGTPLTASNLGYAAGEVVRLKVSVYYRDTWFNYTETRYLRVHVARAPYPWPDDWYGGDTHYHTMYTNNTAEFGAPLPAVVASAKAMGLSWLTPTDHSCDLDETGDGAFSYATSHWEYTIQDESGTHTFYRDNTAIGATWDVLGDEVALFDSPDFRLYRAVELNSSSIDADSYEKTLHGLFYNDGYIDSPLSGAIGERPVTPPLPDALLEITGNGFAYAAHPLNDLGGGGGLDLGVNGAPWGDEDIATALGYEVFRGFEAFNTRATLYSADQNNPWPDFDAGVPPDDPHPNELLQGISLWDDYLSAYLDPVRKVFLAGGSDAHGDFNYSTYLALDSYATDNAIGKVQTVVFVPDQGQGWGADDLPPMSEILSAYRAGRSVVTDGPFVEIGVDSNGDGDFEDSGDLTIGDDAEVIAIADTPMIVRWSSTEDFGPVVAVELFIGSSSGTSTLLSLDPSSSGEEWSGERIVDLGAQGFDGPRFFRAECRTDSSGEVFRAYTNPIWINFDATSVAEAEGASLNLSLARNPFEDGTEIKFTVPASGEAVVRVFDVSGRCVRAMRASGVPGRTTVLSWDGRDARGARVASGLYLFRLDFEGGSLHAKGILLR